MKTRYYSGTSDKASSLLPPPSQVNVPVVQRLVLVIEFDDEGGLSEDDDVCMYMIVLTSSLHVAVQAKTLQS